MSIIGRCEYEKTCSLLVQLFDQTAQHYQELISSVSAPQIDIQIQEGEFLVPLFICAKFGVSYDSLIVICIHTHTLNGIIRRGCNSPPPQIGDIKVKW